MSAGFIGCGFGIIPQMQILLKNTVYLWVGLWLVSGLMACDSGTQAPAPVGELSTLEQLAKAYNSVSEQYPMQPQVMPPKGRKEFVDRVFRQAGYSYSATLIALGQSGADTTDQNQRDLAELLLLPTQGQSDEALGKLYSADELAAVQRLRADFR